MWPGEKHAKGAGRAGLTIEQAPSLAGAGLKCDSLAQQRRRDSGGELEHFGEVVGAEPGEAFVPRDALECHESQTSGKVQEDKVDCVGERGWEERLGGRVGARAAECGGARARSLACSPSVPVSLPGTPSVRTQVP